MSALVPAAALAVAFVLGLIPAVPALAQQATWLVAIVLVVIWTVLDRRRRAREREERAARHRERMAERGMDVPPSQRAGGRATDDPARGGGAS